MKKDCVFLSSTVRGNIHMGEVLEDLPWIMYSQSADKIYSFWQEHN